MSQARIGEQRLRAQLIAAPRAGSAEEVVAHLGAVQAQDYLGALWAVGQRVPGALEAEIEAAVASGSIVRTWPLRGTLHFVAARDVRWMLRRLTPRVLSGTSRRLRAVGLSPTNLARAERLVLHALEGNRRLTRAAVYQVLERGRVSTAGQRGMHLLWYLAHRELLCFGPREDKQPTFVLLDEWVAPAPPRDPDDALAELTRRYFHSHGPATLADFTWWSGLSPADARRGLELLGKELKPWEVNGVRLWRADNERPGRPSAKALLLPAFDEYLVAYRDRSAVLDASHVRRVNNGGGLLSPVIVIGGRVIGTWKRALGTRGVTVSLAPFTALKAGQLRAIEEAAGRYAAFLGTPLLALRGGR